MTPVLPHGEILCLGPFRPIVCAFRSLSLSPSLSLNTDTGT